MWRPKSLVRFRFWTKGLSIFRSIQDKTGLDCYQLAKIDEIKSIVRPSPKFKIKTESEDPKSIVKDQKCDICQVDGLTEIEYKKHLTSMVHQFKLARQNPEVKVHYVIPEANPGYQMMLRSGKNLVWQLCAAMMSWVRQWVELVV